MQHPLPRQILDQTAHAAAGALIVFLLVSGVGVSVLLAFIASCFACLVRELIQHAGRRFGSGAHLDIAFWTAGAFICAIILI